MSTTISENEINETKPKLPAPGWQGGAVAGERGTRPCPPALGTSSPRLGEGLRSVRVAMCGSEQLPGWAEPVYRLCV